MPDQEKESVHPKAWTLQKIIEWSQTTVTPLDENSTPEQITAARNSAISDYLQGCRREKQDAMLRIKERIKMHYELGTEKKKIVSSYGVRWVDVEKWAVKEKWVRPAEPEDAPEQTEDDPGDASLIDRNFGIVTRESEEKMPTHVRQMREQKRLMSLKGSQWENVPYDMQPLAVRMRMLRQVRRAVEIMEKRDDDELMADLKGMKTVAEVLEKVAPIPEGGSGGKKTLLHLSVYNGDDGLPLKKAKTLELEPVAAAPAEAEVDPML